MSEEAIARIKGLPCWQHLVSVEPLSGGMTNLNYRVQDGDNTYVVRLGDSMPEHLLWRENEGTVSQTAADCGFSPRVVHREQGLLVIDFIEGHVFTESDVRQPDNIKRLVPLLRRFHQQMPQKFDGYPVIFWVFQVLRHYCNMLQQADSPHCRRVAEFEEISARLEKDVGPVDIVFGHNDLLAANFIDDGDKIWLIDFDYAGFNSPLFDLANLASNSEFDEADERMMLEQYFAEPLQQDRWKSYRAMKCASLLREAMWSMVSESYSRIDFDYGGYTRENDRRFTDAYADYRAVFG